MLKNKNQVRGEIKLVDKKEEDSLESIRSFNLINEDAKKSNDEYVAKAKQRGKDMKNLMREAEAKYHPDLNQSKDIDVDSDPESGYTNKSLGSDKDKDSGSDTDSSIDFTTSKPKTTKFKCEECNEELALKNYSCHIQSLKHKKSKDKDINKDITKDNITEGYCDVCITRYNTKTEHSGSDEHKENVKQKKLDDKKWRDKVRESGLDHNMKHNQIIITSSNYEDPKFLNILESLHNIHPHIKFNTFDEIKYTRPTDDKLEENEFFFRLMTRQYNGAHDLDLLNGVLETRTQEQKMNRSGWSMQRFIKRTINIHRFYPSGGCGTELPFTSRYILNIHNSDNKCLLCCVVAYLHPAPHNPSRVSNYNKPEYINKIKLPNGVTPPYDYYHLKKIQELNKDKVLFNVFNLNKNKTINPVLINPNDPNGCNILY